MRKLFIIIGVVLGIIVAGGIFAYMQISRPIIVEVPVAIGDIPVGSVLKSSMFRVAQMANVDKDTLDKWITVSEWSRADGKAVTSDIRAGFPIAEAQIDPNSSRSQETRLSLALTGKNDYYIVLPVGPNDVGNYIQPGDRIDMLISLGNANSKEKVAVQQPSEIRNTNDLDVQVIISDTAPMPMSKLVVQNMTVLRVDRDVVRAPAGAQQSPTQPTALGNVMRLYVRVDRDQLEVLSFVMNNGKQNIAVRAASGSTDTVPADGVTWEDFIKWFYTERSKAPGNPFNAISPRTP